jgi:hypothetical protein
MKPADLFPLRRKSYYGFLLPSAGFEPANLGYNGKHDNQQTTDNVVAHPVLKCCVPAPTGSARKWHFRLRNKKNLIAMGPAEILYFEQEEGSGGRRKGVFSLVGIDGEVNGARL